MSEESARRATEAPIPEERELIAGFLCGDAEACRLLDGWIEVAVRGNAHFLQAEWEDIAQEVRVRLLRNLGLGHFRGHSTLRTYVHRVAKNVCIDLGRRTRRRGTLLTLAPRALPASSASGPLAASITRDLLAKILVGVSEEDRLLLELIVVHQYSYAEAAEELSIALGTVKSRLSRCKDRMLRARGKLLKAHGAGR